MYLFVSACICLCLQASKAVCTMAGVCTHRAEHVPAFVGLYQGDEHEFAFLALLVAACIFVHRVLHMLPRIKCWACMLCACVCMYQRLRILGLKCLKTALLSKI